MGELGGFLELGPGLFGGLGDRDAVQGAQEKGLEVLG